jgi:dipeptidyl aminopeptidase/acylaminoacyl peptidase
LRANAKTYELDKDRIGAWGASAGGHLAALLGTTGGVKEVEGEVGGNLDQSSRVQAVCDFFGPTDLVDMATDTVLGKKAAELLGGLTPENRDMAALASPVTHVDKDDPPFLIMHGDRDKVVPIAQSAALYKALKAAGADATAIVVKGKGHGFGELNTLPTVADFFDKHLRAKEATSRPASRPAPDTRPADE